MIARIPLVLEPQPEGGYTVTSPLLPELITEGDTLSEALANVEDAFAAEIYEDRGRPLPSSIYVDVETVRCPSRRSFPLREI